MERIHRLAAALVLPLAMFGGPAAAQDRVVVDDYPSVAAAVAALTAGSTLWFNAGTYDVTGIDISLDGIHVTGSKGATLRAASAAAMLTLRGANSQVSGLTFDLNDQAQFGIEAHGAGFRAYDNTLFNGYNSSSLAAIYYNDAPGPAWITNNRIFDLDADNGGNNGEGAGAVRAIRVRVSSIADAAAIFIQHNAIEQIKGREGDAIHVHSDLPLSTAKIFIEDNYIKDANRRAIKVQAQHVVVRGNVHTNTLSAGQLGNAKAVIESLNENTVIADNVIDASLFPNGIVVSKGNCSITDNTITAPLATSGTRAIHLTAISGPIRHCTITGNRIKNPANITIDLGEGGGHVVAHNSIDVGAIQGSVGIRLSGTRQSTITGNLAFSSSDNIVYLVEMLSQSDDNSVTDNSARFPADSGNYAAVKIQSSARSVVTGNVSNCSTFSTITGADSTAADNHVSGNINLAD